MSRQVGANIGNNQAQQSGKPVNNETIKVIPVKRKRARPPKSTTTLKKNENNLDKKYNEASKLLDTILKKKISIVPKHITFGNKVFYAYKNKTKKIVNNVLGDKKYTNDIKKNIYNKILVEVNEIVKFLISKRFSVEKKINFFFLKFKKTSIDKLIEILKLNNFEKLIGGIINILINEIIENQTSSNFIRVYGRKQNITEERTYRLQRGITTNRVTNASIKLDIRNDINFFFTQLAIDMIHDIGNVKVNNFHEKFGDVLSLLNVKDKDRINNMVKEELVEFHNKRIIKEIKNKKTIEHQKGTYYMKPQVDDKMKNGLNEILKGENTYKITRPFNSRSEYNKGSSLDFIAYKIKSDPTKYYYKKFSVLLDSDKKIEPLYKFIQKIGSENQNQKKPLRQQLLTTSQAQNAGLHVLGINLYGRIHTLLKNNNPGASFLQYDERKVNYMITIDNSTTIQLTNYYDKKGNKFITFLNGKQIDITTAKKSGTLDPELMIGKFLGDFMMILKVLSENSKQGKNVAFGTIDNSAAYIYLKMAKKYFKNIKPRLFFAREQRKNRINEASIMIHGMEDIISPFIKSKGTQQNKEKTKKRITKKIKNKVSSGNFVAGSPYNNNNNNNRFTPTPKKGKKPVRSQSAEVSLSKKEKKPVRSQSAEVSLSKKEKKPVRSQSAEVSLSKRDRNRIIYGNNNNITKKISLPMPPQKNDPTTVLNFNSNSNSNTSRIRSVLPKKSQSGSKRQKLQTNIRTFLLPKS